MKDLFLILNVLDVFVALYHHLLNCLHSEHLSSEAVLDEVHRAKAASPKHSKLLQVLQTVLLRSGWRFGATH